MSISPSVGAQEYSSVGTYTVALQREGNICSVAIRPGKGVKSVSCNFLLRVSKTGLQKGQNEVSALSTDERSLVICDPNNERICWVCRDTVILRDKKSIEVALASSTRYSTIGKSASIISTLAAAVLVVCGVIFHIDDMLDWGIGLLAMPVVVTIVNSMFCSEKRDYQTLLDAQGKGKVIKDHVRVQLTYVLNHTTNEYEFPLSSNKILKYKSGSCLFSRSWAEIVDAPTT